MDKQQKRLQYQHYPEQKGQHKNKKLKKKGQSRTKPEEKQEGHLVATAGFAGAWGPINDDETKTHYHKQEADSSETGSLEERSEWIHYERLRPILFRQVIKIDHNCLKEVHIFVHFKAHLNCFYLNQPPTFF